MTKHSLLILAAALAAVACEPSKTPRLFNEKDFRTSVDGKEVALYTLSNGGVTGGRSREGRNRGGKTEG